MTYSPYFSKYWRGWDLIEDGGLLIYLVLISLGFRLMKGGFHNGRKLIERFTLQMYLINSSEQFSSVKYPSVNSSSVQFRTVQFSSVQFSSVQFSSVQFSSVQFSSVQFSSVQFILQIHHIPLKNLLTVNNCL